MSETATTAADSSGNLGEGPEVEMLQLGAEGADVVSLQRALKAIGFDPGPVSGKFDEDTEEAVKAVQRKLGLKPTGKYTPSLKAAIKEDLANGPASVLRPSMSAKAAGAPQQARPQNAGIPRPNLAAVEDAKSPLRQILGSPLLWLLAGGALIYIFSKSAQIELDDAVEEEDGGGFGEEEEDLAEAPAPRRRPRRKRSGRASSAVVDVKPSKVEVSRK